MANENLIPQSERTKEKQSEVARLGGIASGKARAEKRDLRKAFEALLDKEYNIKNKTTGTTSILSGAELIALKQMEKAAKGDTKAFEVVRDTSGQKPVEKVMIAEVEQSVIDEIERAVLDIENDTTTSN